MSGSAEEDSLKDNNTPVSLSQVATRSIGSVQVLIPIIAVDVNSLSLGFGKNDDISISKAV